jgi:hypothetical protein
MLRRFPTAPALLALALAACATVPHESAPNRPAGVEQLRGIPGAQTRSLRSMGGDDHLSDESVMREGMFGGSNEVYVAATAYRVDRNIGLDLIVLNHRAEAVALDRNQVMLYDASGQPLTPVADFSGAAGIGLRGRAQVEAPTIMYEAPEDHANGPALPAERPLPSSKQAQTRATAPAAPRGRANTDWRALEAGASGGSAPSTLRVASGEGRPWWAYWSAKRPIEFPLTAFVVLGDEQLMFQFDSEQLRSAR